MAKRTYRVVVNLDVRHQAAREVIAGVLRFAAKHPEWDVQMRGNHPSNDGFMLDPKWTPDGLIIDDAWQTRDGGKLLAIPFLRGVIFTSTLPPTNFRVPHESVATDDRALAVAAAKLFRQHGLSNFAFIGTSGNERWCEARKRFFRAALKDAGFGLSVYESPRPARKDWSEERKAMAEWLKSLPKPCGVWAAYDQRAMHVLDVCRKIGVSVPEQVQILGVDDESYICVRAVTERLSTTDLSGSGSHVSRALDLIRRKATEGLSVAAVVKQIGGSERLLEKNFSEVVGHSICREIQNVRLEKVKDLLRKTSLPINAIAERCAFGSGNYLKNLFLKRFGQTMSAYRSANR